MKTDNNIGRSIWSNMNHYLLPLTKYNEWRSLNEFQRCKKSTGFWYSLISMRMTYYFNTWAIIWHGNVPVFLNICKKFGAFARKIVLVIVSVVKLFRNNNKNNFVSKCCKFLANLCKSLEILEQCHVKWWLKYRNNRSVLWRLSCNSCVIY